MRHFAELTSSPYARYRSEADGEYRRIASKIAEAFSDVAASGMCYVVFFASAGEEGLQWRAS